MNFWKIHGICWVVLAALCVFGALKYDPLFWLAGGFAFYAAFLATLLAEKEENQPQAQKQTGGA